jgi:hypothetical protein
LCDHGKSARNPARTDANAGSGFLHCSRFPRSPRLR